MRMIAPTDTEPVRPRPPTSTRYLVLAALCLATIIAYIDRSNISVAAKPIRDDLGLTNEQVGLLMSTFFMTYAVFQLPTGWLGHVWGSRRGLPFFCVMWSAATGICGLAAGFPGLLFGRLAMGAAEAGIFPCATSTIARWFPPTRRAFASGILASCMGVGGALGAGLTALLLQYYSWRIVFLMYVLPGVVWAIWFWFWFRDRPADHPAVNTEELEIIHGPLAGLDLKQPDGHEPTPWRRILTSRAMWSINLAQFFKAAGYAFHMSWMAIYLEETRGVSLKESGILTSLPHVALTIGALCGGILSDAILQRTGSRRLARQAVTFVSLMLAAALTLGAFFVDHPVLASIVISVGIFCGSLSGSSAYAITMDMGGKHVATVFGMMNMSGNLGAVVFPLLVPPLVSLAGWDSVLLLVTGLYVVAALFWLPFNANGSIVDRPSLAV